MTPEKQALQAKALAFGQSGSEEDLLALADYLMNELPLDQWPEVAIGGWICADLTHTIVDSDLEKFRNGAFSTIDVGAM